MRQIEGGHFVVTGAAGFIGYKLVIFLLWNEFNSYIMVSFISKTFPSSANKVFLKRYCDSVLKASLFL